MPRTISDLIQEMLAIYQNENGLYQGGYMSLSQGNTGYIPESSNDRCSNGHCKGSINTGNKVSTCSNGHAAIDCAGSRNAETQFGSCGRID